MVNHQHVLLASIVMRLSLVIYMNPKSNINQTLKKVQSAQIRADLDLNTGVRYSGI